LNTDKAYLLGLIIGGGHIAAEKVERLMTFDAKLWIILALLLVFHFLYKKKTAKKPSPILMIVISAGLGILCYGVLPF